MNTLDHPPGPRSMRAEYRSALRQELEAMVANPTRQHRWLRGQFGSWTHRAVVVAVAAAIVVVFFVPLPRVTLFHNLVAPAKVGTPTNPSSKLPVVDVSATPKGWVPVAYGDAQISVPPTWWVLYNPSVCDTGSKVGDVFINPSGGYCGAKGIPKTETTVVLKTAPRYKNPAKYGQRQVHNGIPVYELNSFAPTPNGGTYLIPSLGVEIEVEGPLAKRVIDTLSGSPRTVAIASGPAPSVPSGWHTVSFAGLTFSVPLGHSQTRRGVTLPADWTVNQTSKTPGLGAICRTPGVAFPSTTVTLSTDAHPLPIYYCPVIPPTPEQPENGVQVDSGLRSEPMLTISFSDRCLSLNGLTACPATSPAYSILILKVTVPGRKNPNYVSIGLAGNGMIARTILYSLLASPASGHPLQIAGTIAGTLVRVGGPNPGAVALPGQVTAKSSTGRKFTVTVGKSGKFVLSVSPGEYQLTGHSPLVRQETCMATKPVRVKTGQRVSGVEVICSIS